MYCRWVSTHKSHWEYEAQKTLVPTATILKHTKTSTQSRLFVHQFTEKPNKLAQRSTSNWKVFILSDDFISAMFSLSSAWWRSCDERTKPRIDQPRTGKKRSTFLDTIKLILIAWKLLFIYGIEKIKSWRRRNIVRISNDFSSSLSNSKKWRKTKISHLLTPAFRIGAAEKN